MKSYQLLQPQLTTNTAELIQRIANKLDYLGFVIIRAQLGRSLSIVVQPNAATQLLRSVCTGQGWDAGRMYKSYVAIVDGVKIVWHKPIRP